MIICPQCRNNSLDFLKVKYYCKSDNLEGLAHSHVECLKCGENFNYWHESEKRLKEVFGSQFETYK